MSVSTEINAAGPFLCNGTQTEFPFTFPVLEAEHIAVWVDGEQITEDGFSVVLSGEGSTGGTVIMNTAPKADALLAVIRDVPITQLTDIQNHTAFLPEVIEIMADKLTMICQQLEEELNRCVKVPPGSSDSPDALWDTLDGIVETSLTSASNAATSAATAGDIAAQIAYIWTELTGDDTLFDKAFATAEELMEAKGAIDAAAAAGIAGVNEASLAALNAAKTEINEAKDSSLESLDAALGSAEGSLALKLAEAQGAAKAAEAAQAAAETAGGAAQVSASAAQAAADSAATKAGEAAGSSSAALAARQEAESAKVAAQAAQAAAEAAAGNATSQVNNSIVAHNANPEAHTNAFNQYGATVDSKISTAVSAHNSAASPHPGKFESAGAVSTHRTAVNAHPMLWSGELNFNNITDTGFYYHSKNETSGSLVNAPDEESTYYLMVQKMDSTQIDGARRVRVLQVAYRPEPKGIFQIYARFGTSDANDGTLTWTAWKLLGGAVSHVNGNFGYTSLPNGLMMQWGVISHPNQDVLFPVSFPTMVCAVTFGVAADSAPTGRYIETGTLTKTGFTYKSSAHTGTYYIAIGC